MNFQNVLSKINEMVTPSDPVRDVINAVNPSQIQCKEWLIEKLAPYIDMYNDPKILIAAGWHGLHSHMIYEKFQIKCTSFDMDPYCKSIKLFPKVNYETAYIEDYDPSGYDFIICTSCEHISNEVLNNFLNKKKKSAIAFLQSNNYYSIEEHINCQRDCDSFANCVNLNIMEKHTLSLEKYNRFMIVCR